jgi:hypothetical protein
MPTFDLTVEGEFDPENPMELPKPRLQLTHLEWNGASPPDVIQIGSVTIIKVGRYLTSGNHYSYRLAVVSKLIEGKLSAAII